MAFEAFAAGVAADLVRQIIRRYGPPPEPLAVRAQEVSDALTRAGALFAELQTDKIDARTALIDSLANKAKDAESRAEDAIRRADLIEEQAKAVDAYLERAVKAQLAKVERNSRRREWGLAIICHGDRHLVVRLLARVAAGEPAADGGRR